MNAQFVVVVECRGHDDPADIGRSSWVATRGFPDCARLDDVWQWASQVPNRHGRIMLCIDEDPSV